MTRTDRLYAIVESLRAAALGGGALRTVAQLADEHGVSSRTIQRDLQQLLAQGVPLRWEDGRGGGWTILAEHSLPPVNLTSEEAIALSVVVQGGRAGPFHAAASRALRKIQGVLGEEAAGTSAQWQGQVRVVGADEDPSVMGELERALGGPLALGLDYSDADGALTQRVVEPVGLIRGGEHWYLVAWCRSRGAVRGFRLDRIRAATALAEPVARRDLDEVLRADGPPAGRSQR